MVSIAVHYPGVLFRHARSVSHLYTEHPRMIVEDVQPHYPIATTSTIPKADMLTGLELVTARQGPGRHETMSKVDVKQTTPTPRWVWHCEGHDHPVEMHDS